MNELEQVKDYLQSLQSRIVAELEQLDGKARYSGAIPGSDRVAAVD